MDHQVPDARFIVSASLSRVHLPKLADANAVEYDRSNGAVSSGPELECLLPSLELTVESDLAEDDPWRPI